ncbi:MAG: hypothetical protein K0S37_748 [Microbacterium sp.]|jgi:hypothetical protein|nr:hypothetical protein [Microbacterium sp.]
MGATLANGIWKPGDLEPIDWHVTPSIFGAAAAIAAAGRSDMAHSPVLFRAADALEATGIKVKRTQIGDQIYRADTRWVEENQPSGWKIVRTFSGISFVPQWASVSPGITPGNGANFFTYWVNGERITVQGTFIFGGTTTLPNISGQATRLPVAPGLPMRAGSTNLGVIGQAAALSGAAFFGGAVIGMWGTGGAMSGQVHPCAFLRGPDPNSVGEFWNMGATHPFTWVSGNQLMLHYSYIA